MKIELGAVVTRRGAKSVPAEALLNDYVGRAAKLAEVESARYASETALLAAAERSAGHAACAAAHLVLLDARGQSVTSEELAQLLGRLRDEGAQRLLVAVGPADGWSEAARRRADRQISLGAITLPHELARVVAAEQIYRALTILAGHPYHTSH